MGEILNLHNGILHFLHKEPVFTLLSGHIDLQKNVHIQSELCRVGLNLLGQAQGIHRVNQHGLVNDLVNFVALQMTNHMPSDILRKLRFFVQDFLYLVLTEIPGPGIISLHKHGNGFCFADSDESHFLRISSRPAAGIFNMLSYFFQLFFYHIVFLPYWYSSCPSSTMEASSTMWSYTDKPYFMFFRTV